MSVKDDLIAARALIDTPEKVDALHAFIGGERWETIYAASSRFGDLNGLWVRKALREVNNGDWAKWLEYEEPAHADIMALFDRAIEAAS